MDNTTSKLKQKTDLANELYNNQDDFDSNDLYEIASVVIDLGYRKVCKPVIKNGEVIGFVNGADYVPKNLLTFGIHSTRKATAEEFAERLKEIFKYEAHQQWIDEICKEFTEVE